MSSINKENIIIVGGTSGIGLATAVSASAKGANVWAVSRSKDRVKTCSELHPNIHFSSLDTHDVPGLKSLFGSIGNIDHIVAAATGAERTMAPFIDQTDEQFREAFNKFWGYTHVAREGLPYLKEEGSLTFVSGTPARKCNPGMSSVSCTGSAVEGLTRALALEAAPKRINAVAPGLISTGMFDSLGDSKNAALENMSKNIPLGRVGKAEEVAKAIIMIMQNTYMTGTTIDVDGGILLP